MPRNRRDRYIYTGFQIDENIIKTGSDDDVNNISEWTNSISGARYTIYERPVAFRIRRYKEIVEYLLPRFLLSLNPITWMRQLFPVTKGLDLLSSID